MKKVLVGMVCDGAAGGVDKYITNFFQSVKTKDIKIDFLTNLTNSAFLKHVESDSSELFCVSGLGNPFKQYKQIKNILKNGYDVLYLNVSTSLTVPAFLAAKSAGVKKIIAHSHSSGYDCNSALKRKIMTFLHNILKKLLCECVTEYLACSDKAAQWMFTPEVLENKKVKIIRNTADLNCFCYNETKRKEIRNFLGIDDKFVIGFVGNMVYAKNPVFLADMFNQIIKKESNSVLVTIGDGPLAENFKERISEYKLENHLVFLGRTDASQGYMSAFDVLVLPSNFEGMPMVSIEAQCSKLPCVLSDNISKMAKISNMCDFVSTENAEIFAAKVIEYKNRNRDEHEIFCDLSDFSLEKQKAVLKEIIDLV